MSRSRHTEAQMIAALKQMEAGRPGSGGGAGGGRGHADALPGEGEVWRDGQPRLKASVNALITSGGVAG